MLNDIFINSLENNAVFFFNSIKCYPLLFTSFSTIYFLGKICYIFQRNILHVFLSQLCLICVCLNIKHISHFVLKNALPEITFHPRLNHLFTSVVHLVISSLIWFATRVDLAHIATFVSLF